MRQRNDAGRGHAHGRRFAGIDILPDAIALTRQRLACPVRTDSALMRDGMEAYVNDDPWVEAHLVGFSHSRIQRNSGLDAVLKESVGARAAFIRVQRNDESLAHTIFCLKKSLANKGDAVGFVIATQEDLISISDPEVTILVSPSLQLRLAMRQKPPVPGRMAKRA